MRMMSKLRKKVVTFSLISIFAILATIVAIINIYNFSMVAISADETLNHIKENGGKLETMDPGDNPPNGPEGNETTLNLIDIRKKQYDADYFTYAFDSEGNATKIAFVMPDMSSSSALEMAEGLRNSSGGWTEFYYRYIVYEYSNQTYVTVSNQKRELEPSYRVLWSSIVGVLVGMVFSLLACIPISKWMVMPIESAISKQKRFVSDASHELKTPVAIISLNNELEVAEKGESENTTNISNQIASLASLVTSLNALAKLDEEEKIIFSPLDLSSLANDVVATFAKVFETESKTFISSIEEGITFQGNHELLKHLFTLILDNAAKYSISNINFSVKKEMKKIIIEERNDSENIQNGDLSVIFERFYRLQEHRSSNIGGSGLGLAMAKDIVTKHKGEISARGENGYFIIRIEL